MQDVKSKLEKLLTDEQKQTVSRHRGPGGPPEGRRDGNGPPPREPGRGRGSEAPNGPPRDRDAADSDRTPAEPLKELPKGVTRVPISFSGGHETDSRDGGRPVVLIAAALGVTPEVFRDAFSRVKPARGGTEPEPEKVRQNKAVLLEALGKHGVTNDELDRVSNYYRYVPGRNSLWTNEAAVANALVKEGAIVEYEIVSGGSGYSSTPKVSVPNFKNLAPKIEIAYGKSLDGNGSVRSIAAAKNDQK